MDPVTVDAGKSLLSNGVLGIVVVGLVYFIIMLRREAREREITHRAELEARDNKIYEIQELRIVENKQGYVVAASVEQSLDALLLVIRSGK